VQAEGSKVLDSGTYVVMEGPAFSTKAESHMYRLFGATVVGMTAFPEAKLAREAEIAYCLVALVTDYDCWREGHESVTVDMVIQVLKSNGALAQKVVSGVVSAIAANPFESPVHNSLQFAILTPTSHIPEATKTKLRPILSRYLSTQATPSK